MKILIINGIYGERSSGRSILDIKTRLTENGDQVFVATPNNYSGDEFYRIGNTLDHKLHALLSRLIGKQAYFSHIATRKLLSHIDSVRPDLVHVQVIHGNYLNFPLLMNYLAQKNIPAVFVLDDCWYYTGKCCHYTSDRCHKWKTLCHDCPRVHKDNPSLFLDRSIAMHQHKKRLFSRLPRYAVVTVSDWLKSEVEQSYLKDATIVRRIYNAIDINVFRYRSDCVEVKARLGLQNCQVILGVAAAWKDHQGLSKGIKYFIELAGRLPQEIRIVLIGKPDPDLALPDNIVSIPFVGGAEELSRYYSMADVFVQMSREETFGKVTAEALSCGTPAVVFNTTANPELIGPGCGAVVPDRDLDAMLRNILLILKIGRGDFSASCRKFAERNFDANVISRQFLKLYHDLLDVK